MRGGIVRLNQAYLSAIKDHDYPLPVASAIGELTAATALLASSLKWQGALIIQLQSNGALALLCAESSHTLDVRAVATINGQIAPDATPEQMMPQGRVVITLDPNGMTETGQMYQGIVALNSAGIAATIEDYMTQSQQVQTCVILCADQNCAAGIFVQKLPGDDTASAEGFERIVALTRTLSDAELLSLDAPTLLARLYHEEVVRVLPEQSVRFFCPCTEERVLGALRLMGRTEVESILDEYGQVDADCQFCNRAYSFERNRLMQLFAETLDVQGSPSKH